MHYRISCLVIAIGCFEARAADIEELAALCSNGHLQARTAIRTLRCRCVIETPARKELSPYDGTTSQQPAKKLPLDWWQDGELIRARRTYPPDGITNEFLWAGGILKTLRNQKETPPDVRSSGQIESDKGLETLESPWRLALFGWPSKIPLRLEPPFLKSIEPVDIHGNPCYRVVSRWDDGWGETWFDIRHNFLVRKSIMYPTPNDNSLWFGREVSSFRECKPGVYFPEVVVENKSVKGQVTFQDRIVFEDVQINEPIDPGVFKLSFPVGASVTDSIKGIVYTADANEQPSDTPRPVAPPRGSANILQYPTAMTSPSYFTPVAIALACILAASAVGLFVWMRVKKAQ